MSPEHRSGSGTDRRPRTDWSARRPMGDWWHGPRPRRGGAAARNDAGLVPAIAQQHDTGEVLMLGWMDDEALARTLATGRATYWSRSRGEYWVKGETSGHRQWVTAVRLDCDGDTAAAPGRPGGPGVPHRARAPASTPTCSGSRRTRRGDA